MVVEKFPGPTRWTSPAASTRRSTRCGPACPDPHRQPHLPARRVHRDPIANLDRRPAPGHAARGARARRVPVRVAGCRDQPGRNPALADGRRARALCDGRDDQHDGARRVRDLGRGGRRRRDHRHREHRPPPAPEPRIGVAPAGNRSRARRIARGAEGDRLRDPHHRPRGDAGLLHPERLGRVLPPARHLLRPRGPRLDGRRADRDTCARPPPARPRAARREAAAARAAPPAAVRRGPQPGRAHAHPRGRCDRRDAGRGDRRDAVPRRVALPDVQGAGLPRALGDPPRHRAQGGRAHRRAGEPRPALDSWRSRVRRAHRPGGAGRGDQRHQLRRELAQPEPARRLRQDAPAHPGDSGRLSGSLPRADDLSERADRRGARRLERGDHDPHLRPGPRDAAGRGPRGALGDAGDQGRRRPAHRAPGRTSRTSGSSRISRRPRSTD